MKRKLLLALTLFSFISLSSFAQMVIAAWTFPTGTAYDANPDIHDSKDTSVVITTQGGTSAIDFTKNGVTTKSAQATGWDGGANLKYWQIEVNTIDNHSLNLSSKLTSGGTFPGPRDWKVQYKIGASGTWTDILGTTMINANNWTSATLSNIPIPIACNNKPSVFIRWLMTSDTSTAPPALVQSSGTIKIDDIYIRGLLITSIDEVQPLSFSIFPNPSAGVFIINTNQVISELSIFNIQGRQVFCRHLPALNQSVDLSGMEKGMYFIRFRVNGSDGYKVEKILLQ
jgi:hypothetical protein